MKKRLVNLSLFLIVLVVSLPLNIGIAFGGDAGSIGSTSRCNGIYDIGTCAENNCSYIDGQCIDSCSYGLCHRCNSESACSTQSDCEWKEDECTWSITSAASDEEGREDLIRGVYSGGGRISGLGGDIREAGACANAGGQIDCGSSGCLGGEEYIIFKTEDGGVCCGPYSQGPAEMSFCHCPPMPGENMPNVNSDEWLSSCGNILTPEGNVDEEAMKKSAGKACIEKNQKTEGIIAVMDNGIMITLERVIAVMYAICTVWSTIETIFDVFFFITGYVSDNTCHMPAYLKSLCVFSDAARKVISAIGYVAQPLCMVVTCDWGFTNLCNLDIPTGGGNSVNTGTDLKMNPYDNIYTAMGCMCPGAILFNLRKLKTIHQTYNCCVEEACTNGRSIEGCEEQFDEATCMYWYGSIGNTAAKALISIAASVVTNILIKKGSEFTLPAWTQTILKLYQAYQAIAGVQKSWEWMDVAFNEPQCSELGFGEITDSNRQAVALDAGSPTLAITSTAEEKAKHKEYWKSAWNTVFNDANTAEGATHIIVDKDTGKTYAAKETESINDNTETLGIEIWNQEKGKWEPESSIATGISNLESREMPVGTTHITEDGNFLQVSADGTSAKEYYSEEGEWGPEMSYDNTQETEYVPVVSQSEKETSLDSDTSAPKTNTDSESVDKPKADDYTRTPYGDLTPEQTKQQVKSMTYMLLNKVLGPYAYDMVNDYCKEQSQSSSPESITPINYDSGNPIDYSSDSGICGNSHVTSAAVQLYRFPQTDSYNYEWGYSITACKEDMTYTVSIRGNSDAHTVASGVLEKGDRSSDSGEIELNFEADQICLFVADETVGENGRACFPLAWGRTNLDQEWEATE